MSRPGEPVSIPAVVAGIAAGRPVAAVWVNELGGVIYEVDAGAEFFDSYGVAPDQDRLDYYLRLWEDGDDSAADCP